jgi:hypothetical protein
MKWRKPATHKLVPAGDVYRLTGLSAKEILLERDTQRLVRIDANGSRNDFVRIPVELLNHEAGDGDDLRG